jgi:hypothetical protein
VPQRAYKERALAPEGRIFNARKAFMQQALAATNSSMKSKKRRYSAYEGKVRLATASFVDQIRAGAREAAKTPTV